MEFHDKHANYFKLRDVQHLETDTKLLQQLNPDAKPLRRLFEPDKKKLQGEILWALLEVTTPDVIEKNRPVEPEQKTPAKGKKVKKVTPDPENVTEKPENVTEEVIPDENPENGEKKEAPAVEGPGVSADQLGESGESGHTEGDDPVQ